MHYQSQTKAYFQMIPKPEKTARFLIWGMAINCYPPVFSFVWTDPKKHYKINNKKPMFDMSFQHLDLLGLPVMNERTYFACTLIYQLDYCRFGLGLDTESMFAVNQNVGMNLVEKNPVNHLRLLRRPCFR